MSAKMETRRQLVVGAAVVCLTGAGQVAERIPIKAGDDVSGDAELKAFIEMFKRIVARKDAPALLALMRPGFRVEFDHGKGPAAFRALWHPADVRSEVWGLLQRLLSVGGEMHTETLCSVPYVYGRFPVDLDPWQHVVAVKADVAVRARAEAGAPVVERRSHEVLKLRTRFRPPVRLDKIEWISVETRSGGEGFVASADVISPVEHRMFFEKRGGRWVWISLVAAD